MSRRPDGSYMCDRCGIDVGNAGVIECGIFSDLHADTIRVLHFCRIPNDGAPSGCTEHLLTPSHMAAWNAANPPELEPEPEPEPAPVDEPATEDPAPDPAPAEEPVLTEETNV